MIYRPAESLYSTPETDTTLYVNYTEMQFFLFKKEQKWAKAYYANRYTKKSRKPRLLPNYNSR